MLQEEQVKIFLALKRDRKLLRKSRLYIDLKDFDYFPVKTHLSTLLDFYDKYGTLPTKDYYYHVLEETSSYLPDSLKDQLKEILERKLNEEEWKVALEYIKHYVKKKAILMTIEKTSTALASGNLDLAEKELSSFSNFKDVDDDEGTFLFKNEKYTLHKILDEPEEQITVPTFIRELDDALMGGFKPGELNIVLGLPGRGKTAFACHLAKVAAFMRIPTLYVSLEVSERDVVKRLVSAFTGVAIPELPAKMKEIERKLKRLGKMCGDVLVKQFPTGKCSLGVLRSYIKYIRAEFPFKFLIVDYADLLVGSSFLDKERRYALELIFTELRSFAVEENIIVFSPSQANRQALNTEVVQMEHVSESFAKMMVADVVLSINQAPDEREAGRMRIFIAKNRNGLAYRTIPLYVDFSKTLFRSLREDEEF